VDDLHLYQQIVESIRQEILTGTLKPGDCPPSVRQMTLKWECTNATVLRAYQELARQGLVVSHVGKGTKVIDKLLIQDRLPLRRVMLLNRIEANLLEIMSAGYSPDEVEQVTRMALDRWRIFSTKPEENPPNVLRFVGGHDPAMALKRCPQIKEKIARFVVMGGSIILMFYYKRHNDSGYLSLLIRCIIIYLIYII